LEDKIEVVIGVDAQRHTDTLVACDQMGQKASVRTVEATTDGAPSPPTAGVDDQNQR